MVEGLLVGGVGEALGVDVGAVPVQPPDGRGQGSGADEEEAPREMSAAGSWFW